MGDSTVYRVGLLNVRLEQMDDAIRAVLLLTGKRIVFKAIALQEQERPSTIATGQTIRSHTVSPVREGIDSSGKFLAVRVGPRTGYALWGIEKGRRPGGPYPPLNKIIAWVREKPGGSSLTDRDLYAIAKATQKSIAAFGIIPYGILSRAAAEESRGFEVALGHAVASALNGK